MCRKDALCKAPRFEKGKAQEDGIAPVSYTHLDVYKRQVRQHIANKTAAIKRGFRAAAAPHIRKTDILFRFLNAVSYTHLCV